ncbi:MAG: bifunctional DNA primase/polymerase [bacterium]
MITETRPIAGSNPLLDAALSYAARGWPVVPIHFIDDAAHCTCGKPDCPSPAKHPIGTPHGMLDATCDETQIRDWWRRNPRANVATVTGPRSGILAVDVDPRNGGNLSLESIESEHGRLPDTMRSITGGRGAHYFYRLPPGVTGQCEPMPGIEIYAQEHLLILAPSVHQSGNSYAWAPDFSPDEMTLADPPQWVLNALAEAAIKRSDSPAVAHDCNVPIPQGSRHKALVALAGSLRSHSFSARALDAVLAVTNHERCQPPLDDAEVSRIARDIGAKATTSDPAAVVVAAGERERQFLSKAETALALVNDESVVEPPSIIGDGLAPRGTTLIVAGQGGIGKSWLLIRLALAVARGVPWLGLRTTKSRVGILSFELPRWALKKRVLAIVGCDHEGLDDIVLMGREAVLGLKLPPDADLVAALIRERGLDLVLVDPFGAVQELPGDSGADVGPTIQSLLALSTASDAVVLAAHHVAKPTGGPKRDAIDVVRGHSRLRDDVDAVLVVEPMAGLRRLVFAKVRHGITPDPVWIGPTGDVCDAPEQAKSFKTRNRDAVRDLLRLNAGESLTADQINDALQLKTHTGDPLKTATIRKYLRELEDAGLVESPPVARKSDPKSWRAVVAVTENEEPLQHDEDA